MVAPLPPESRADWCAAELTRAIFTGTFAPGERLNEVELAERFDVSRNTLREAFRLLAHDHLVSHEPNRGVFVTVVDARTAHELYTMRRHIELGALADLHVAQATAHTAAAAPSGLAELTDAVAAGRAAAAAGDWIEAGTANSTFHLALVALANNHLANELMQSLMTRTRLWFMTIADHRAIHESYVEDNAGIAELIEAGAYARAQVALELYLIKAEENIPRLLQDCSTIA